MRAFGIACALAMAATTTPAAAVEPSDAACLFTAEPMVLSRGLYHPYIQLNTGVDILPFHFDRCKGYGAFYTASCSYAHGWMAVSGRVVGVTLVGGVLVLSGGATGSMYAIPDVPGGESCMSGSGADTFLVTGAITLL